MYLSACVGVTVNVPAQTAAKCFLVFKKNYFDKISLCVKFRVGYELKYDVNLTMHN